VNALDANTADDLVQETLTSALANPDTDTDTDTDTENMGRTVGELQLSRRQRRGISAGATTSPSDTSTSSSVHDPTVAMLGAVAGWRHRPGGGAYRIADGDAP
jgi:hypothetical protein